MAMLAEPRRKQKWSVDPRNSTWSKDESKFGQKMLEKMGWSKGKGLGAQEQGSTEHVKVQVKNNTFGLGANTNHEDNWIAHQDDFNQILAELNNFHGTSESESQAGEEKKSFSLEEKSKTSRKRVHYMKFAKGKDLSCRSDTDLACIFGKRDKKTKKKIIQEELEVDSEESEEHKQETPSNDSEPTNTITSTMSVNEYFAIRMAALKKSQTKYGETAPEDTNPDEISPEETKQKSKKKKHKKKDRDLYSNCLDEPETVKHLENEDSICSTDYQESQKRSKKKRKNKEMISENTENTTEDKEPSETSECETVREKPKKRKKKSKREYEESTDNKEALEEEGPMLTEQSGKKKKKKKKNQSD
ncbi:PIN2/TERF1-interacting telomerase inhibitor 1 [Bombina bombina]|uniref:PIN2/TERF1-interacting telomerase inhibitor 1 n=1 Tax=Bombina bombina TaxID=8345 RepID=UPI00235B192E|nr:PIN2/TERF1-interacting telomerase inhibitor 1 [Bombina bombina]